MDVAADLEPPEGWWNQPRIGHIKRALGTTKYAPIDAASDADRVTSGLMKASCVNRKDRTDRAAGELMYSAMSLSGFQIPGTTTGAMTLACVLDRTTAEHERS